MRRAAYPSRTPALVAEPLDSERQQFLVHTEAEVDLSALDVFFVLRLSVVQPAISSRQFKD